MRQVQVLMKSGGTTFSSKAEDNQRTGLEVAGRQELADAQA